MKKYNAAIAAISLLLAAAVTAVVVVLCRRAGRGTPDFIFPEPSPALLSTSETIGAHGTAITDKYAESTESTPGETEETPLIITSNNPQFRSKITLEGFDIIIEGVCEDKYVQSACLASDGIKADAEYDGKNYRIILKNRHSENEYDTVYVFNSDHSITDYRVQVTSDGFSPIDTAEVAENNLRLAENPVTLPREGVLRYIIPDGDPVGAREVINQAEEISDKICEGITDDYDKAFAISQWISDNIYYDFDASSDSVTTETLSLSHVLETHRTVCGGYSNLFSALCAVQGIKVCNIRGEALNEVLTYAETDKGELHEWNYAVINGRGVWVDVGWNSYNTYKDGQYKYNGTQMKYFDLTNTVMSYDHRARTCEVRDYYAVLE